MTSDFLVWRNRSVVVGHGEGRSSSSVCWMGAGLGSPLRVLLDPRCVSKISIPSCKGEQFELTRSSREE
jgi:hypothetical protein